MTTAKRKRELRAAGLCVWCQAPAHVDPETLKLRTLCWKHIQINRARLEKWRTENPEGWAAAKNREKAKRRENRRKERFATIRVKNYLRWLYDELQRLRDLDADGDVKQ